MSVNGSESISEIVAIAEDPILDISKTVGITNDDPDNICEFINEYIESRKENVVEQMGISSGFPIWDQAIGGGLRPGTINVIGARPKSFLRFSFKDSKVRTEPQYTI